MWSVHHVPPSHSLFDSLHNLVHRIRVVVFVFGFVFLFSSSQTRHFPLFLLCACFTVTLFFSYSAQFLKVSSGCWRSPHRLSACCCFKLCCTHFYKSHLISFERIIKRSYQYLDHMASLCPFEGWSTTMRKIDSRWGAANDTGSSAQCLWCPRGVDAWREAQERGGDICAHGWFTLYSRN